jgi:methionine aminopeptidase
MTNNLDKLNTGAKICKNVLNNLIEEIQNQKLSNVSIIANKGDLLLYDQLQTVYKNCKNKMIGFPVCLSIDNCVDNYRASKELIDNCIVKIKLGCNIDGHISLLEKTFQFSKGDYKLKELNNISELEEKCKKICEKNMFHGNTNDEVRKLLEIELLEKGYQPIENCISYQTFEDQLSTSESKYMILNYKKYYNENDELMFPPNLCFEFLNSEVYHITIKFVSNENDKFCITDYHHDSHLYRLNEYYYSLKTKSGKHFYSQIKKESNTNPFIFEDYKTLPLNKIGFKECFDNGVLDEFPVYYANNGVKVYGFTFTMMISNKKGVLVK